jgi:hypothetical protein
VDPIVVEVLDRHGAVTQRVRVERFPAVIGRAYTCDVILDDRHVDAQHARLALTETGGLVIEDLGSVNGLRLAGSASRTASCEVSGGTVVRLGQTTVRIVAADQPVPPALPLPRSGRLATMLEGTRAPLAVALAGLLLTLLTTWLQDPGSASAAAPLGVALAVAGGAALWAGTWALAGRITVHRPAFLPHFALTWLFLVATGVLGLVASYAEFLVPEWTALQVLEALGGILLLVALLYEQLGLATTLSRRRRVVRSVVVVGALIALGALVGKTAESDEQYVRVGTSLKPLPASLVPAGTPERFLERAATLQREVDRLAEEE